MFEQTYIFTRLSASGMAGTTSDVFTNHLARSKVSVQVTRGLSVRVIGDYGTVLAAPALTSIESRRRATADVLATNQVNPFTAMYFGYTSLFDDVGLVGLGGEGPRGTFELPVVSRQLFAKVSYGMRF
jgi:hypothetical protein